VCDLLHFARQVPTVPVQRRMNLAAVAAARRAAQPRPGWAAVVLKAYAQVCSRRPELRRAYLPLPVPHLYEHPAAVAAVAVERRFGDEDAVFVGQVPEPERLSLSALEAELRGLKERPAESVAAFRRCLRISRLPRPLRRLLWWAVLNLSGARRASDIGTFALSVYAGLGAASLHPLSPLTTTLNYGVIGADGAVDVRLIYDHRALDGATVARALADLEGVLTGEIRDELRGLGYKD
jgi:hypothetical protein